MGSTERKFQGIIDGKTYGIKRRRMKTKDQMKVTHTGRSGNRLSQCSHRGRVNPRSNSAYKETPGN